jgi:cytoskeleton protein RodZ
VFEIGNSLREARLRRHIEFVDAEHGTKIRGKYLRALEDERFELLPSHTYIKGFLRSYAEYLGLDGQLYVDEYNSRFVIGEEDAPVRARRVPAAKARRADRRESRIVVLALAAITLVTALVIVAWQFGSPDDEPVHGLTTSQGERQAAAPPPQAAGKARLELRATRGNSYLLVKQASALGELLYQGTLERGQKKFFDGQVLWVRLESPQNVLVRRNGNRVRLPDAVKAQGVFVTAKKIFAADAA